MFIHLPGGRLKNNEHDISQEVLALVGRTVSQLLRREGTVMPEDLTRALQTMSEHSVEAKTRADCGELIIRLMKKMH
ncbi:hypothetical protein HA47_16665 [Pantoea stewartii subsp. indologenes]|uniref:Uncharacterized protein n=1 Tax=Pantoea stewartii TaxID=66269 RepID=A0AB34VH58_9GAMM|nr:hypothetical protein HA47_16665 [Pantoea stewartii subsp. indologenes]KTS74772.1 hypothetical protein RSA30_05705 [Pantoea stewartii]KTS98025.1 hypothetical protein RSA13_10435 [Pantoea stewartii]KTT06741.1 hypothetical protein RSA36_15400 [Pantoea stewartii]